MNNIEKAAYNYPIGTVFISIFTKREYTVAGYPRYYDKGDENICVLVAEKADTEDNTVSIHANGRGWAEIIKKKEEVQYEIY